MHIKLLGDLPVGSGLLEEARLAAHYVGKYAGKALDEGDRPSGLHRYEVAREHRVLASVHKCSLSFRHVHRRLRDARRQRPEF